MCSHAIRECGVSKVFIVEPYPEMGGVTSVHPILVDSTLAYPFAPPAVTWVRM